MREIESSTRVPYPTPYLQGLFRACVWISSNSRGLCVYPPAEEALTWLQDHPPELSFGVASDSSYSAIGGRIRRGISDWRLSIHLQQAYYDLDDKHVESIH